MKIYLITRTDHVEYDEYDSWVVAANDRKEAKALCWWYAEDVEVRVYEINPFKIKKAKAILGSFNAG